MKELIEIPVGFPFPNYPVPLTPALVQEIIAINPVSTVIWVGAAVEPSIAVNPCNPKQIVAAWQQNRISNGGAVFTGIGYSKDGGKTWKQTFAPFPPNFEIQRQTDTWLSWDVSGEVVYLSGYCFNTTRVNSNGPAQQSIASWVSKDGGATWDNFRNLVTSQATQVVTLPELIAASLDKNAVTADNETAGTAYVAWDTFPDAPSYHSDTWVGKTVNFGQDWSALLAYDPFFDPALPSNGFYENCQTINNVILQSRSTCRDPQRTLFNFMVRIYAKPGATEDDYFNDTFPFQYTAQDLALITSTDGGTTWSQTATVIAPITTQWFFTGGYTYDINGNITGAACSGDPSDFSCRYRNDAIIVSQAINPKNNRLYVAYESNLFRSDQLPQIAVQESRDNGVTWTTPFKASRTAENSPNPQAFGPVIAVTKNGFVGVLYADFRNDSKSNAQETLTDVWLAIYKSTIHCPNSAPSPTASGLEFVREVRLTKQSYIMQNGPRTSQGIMTNGDYASLTTHGDTFYACYAHSLAGPFVPVQDNVDLNHRNDIFYSRVPALPKC